MPVKITKGKVLGGFGLVAGGVLAVGLSFSSADDNDGTTIKIGEAWDNFVTSEPRVETSHANRAAYATTVRNPLNIPAGEVEATSVVKESRVPVYMDDIKFDVVGRLHYSNGLYSRNCTATLSDVQGYDVKSGAPLVLSAGHCMLDDSHKFLPIENFTFVMNYIDTNGQLVEFASRLDEASALKIKKEGIDLAAFTLRTPIPEGLSIAVAIPNDHFKIGEVVSAIGYSADKDGAHIDNCKITLVKTKWVGNTCDVTSGASGGPLVMTSNGNSFEYSAIAMGIAPDKMTFHSRITSEFLDGVPFLEREGGQSSVSVQSQQLSHTCLEVTADRLNLRDGPGAEFNVVGKAYKGDQTVELGRSGNWSVIKLEDNRSAYLHSGFAHRFPCSF